MSCELEKAMEILTQEWEKSVRDYHYQNPQKLDREYALDIAIQALQEKQALTQPQQLTLDELRGMDGKPVWCANIGDMSRPDMWAICDWDWGTCSTGQWDFYINDAPDEIYGKTWLAYPSEPGREV